VYPGQRAPDPGTYKIRVLFRGMYNLISAYSAPAELGNQSEASSFYYFFPPILLALVISRRFRSRVGIVGLALAAYLILMSLFAFVRVPSILAKATLLSFAIAGRTDIGFGLASVILSVLVLAGVKEGVYRSGLSKLSEFSELPPWERAVPMIASAAFVILILVTGVMLSLVSGGFPPVSATLMVALVSGFVSFCLLADKRKTFCFMVGSAVIATSAFFNPLSTELDYLYKSELAQKIIELNSSTGALPAPKFGAPASAGSLPNDVRPLWLCYGLAYPEVQVQILGGRTLPGIQWPPQLELWRRLDPARAYERVYNRYAHVQLGVDGASPTATFISPRDDTMVVNVLPTNPVFAQMGARYVLAMYKYQENMDRLGLPVIYKSRTGAFTIYGIPAE